MGGSTIISVASRVNTSLDEWDLLKVVSKEFNRPKNPPEINLSFDEKRAEFLYGVENLFESRLVLILSFENEDRGEIVGKHKSEIFSGYFFWPKIIKVIYN